MKRIIRSAKWLFVLKSGVNIFSSRSYDRRKGERNEISQGIIIFYTLMWSKVKFSIGLFS